MAKKSATTPDKAPKETPLMKQYNEIKNKYPDACLLFRVGDFYETFGEDAVRAAGILGITLTKRGAGSDSETALAGFPHHSLNTYLPKLVKAGLRVAICDQLEDPKMTKTIVKRGVTELVTPGVSMNDEVLQSKSNNFLASIHFGKKTVGVSFLDVSTGEFLVAQGNEEYIDKLLQNFRPSEILIPKQFKNQFNSVFGEDFHTFFLEDWVYKEDYPGIPKTVPASLFAKDPDWKPTISEACRKADLESRKNRKATEKQLQVTRENGMKKAKSICLYDKDGNLLGEYESIISASREMKCDRRSIQRQLQNPVDPNNKRAWNNAKYIWKYKEELTEQSN